MTEIIFNKKLYKQKNARNVERYNAMHTNH